MDRVVFGIYLALAATAVVQAALMALQTYEHRRYARRRLAELARPQPTGKARVLAPCRGVDPDLDSEAARAVSQLGKFLPGKQGGKPVPVYYMVPVTFTLKKDSAIIKPASDLKDTPFVVVEEMPMYPGGDAALLKAIAENVIYPEQARQNRKEGRVIIRFVVTAEGNVDDVTVLKGADPDLDTEAVRVMGQLDKFKPGKQGGKPVDVYYMVPVNFALKKENHSPDTLTRE